MPKGYLVVEIEVTDPIAYERYRAIAGHIPAKYGGKIIIGNGEKQSVEGGWSPASFFVLEFASYERAKAFYFSPEYQSALPLRLESSKSKGILIEGAAES